MTLTCCVTSREPVLILAQWVAWIKVNLACLCAPGTVCPRSLGIVVALWGLWCSLTPMIHLLISLLQYLLIYYERFGHLVLSFFICTKDDFIGQDF